MADLDIHLEGSDSISVSSNLEVHVAHSVLAPQNVCQNRIAIRGMISDEPHGHTRYLTLEWHTWKTGEHELARWLVIRGPRISMETRCQYILIVKKGKGSTCVPHGQPARAD